MKYRNFGSKKKNKVNSCLVLTLKHSKIYKNDYK